MPVYIYHDGAWLEIKEVYAIKSASTSRSKRSSRQRSSPYGIVAVKRDSIDLKGYRYSYKIVVPSSKVSRFAARMHLSSLNVIVAIEPQGDDYVAKIYAKTASEAKKAVEVAKSILASLRRGKESGEAEAVEEVEEVEEGESE